MKKFEITKEQVLKYNMREEFPDAFKPELEVGKWYKTDDVWLFNYQNNCGVYGFTPEGWNPCSCGSWSWSIDNTDGVSEATPQEVENALINEAKKRYKLNNYVYDEWSCCISTINELNRFDYCYDGLFVLNENNSKTRLFHNGKWAEIIQQPKKSYLELNALIVAWASQKGILENGNPMAQSFKTLEEAQELCQAIHTNNKTEIIDALGDILVTIIIQAEMQGVDLIECLETAYNVISKRTGKMVNGQFLKDK